MSTAETETREQRGQTVIAVQALRRVAVGLVSRTADVRSADVSVRLDDAGGVLRASVSLPVSVGRDGASASAQGDAVRRALIVGFDRLAGRRLGTVDVRYSGVRPPKTRRVI
ncbi:hypothetical protein J2Y69_002622 [Microbacterium resistens]|uniref:Ribosome-binding factor A n=1 Tax=Microbacterium resistens TaxID=156977 RepID=A0ABU1SEL0_9MICO|nr:hypothetical protein [Microbacterium resistens]MDR6868014.1 hypothetical protein [Microbacterium resistens]